MQTPDLTAEIAALEAELIQHKILLDKAFADNLLFAETKVIFHQLKLISEKLENLKNSASKQ